MKWYRNGTRLWISEEEIEDSTAQTLAQSGLLPTAEHPVTELELLVEQHLGADLDQHADLDPSVLGVTQFRDGGRPLISINRDLTGSALDTDDPAPGSVGRWRATLAHEASHVLFHRVLFETVGERLFDLDEPAVGGRLMRCLKRDVGFGGSGSDWREVQANRGMAALLMPRALFYEVVRDEVESKSHEPNDLREGTPFTRALVRYLADRLGVSRQAAQIRLQTLGLLLPPGNVPLPGQTL